MLVVKKYANRRLYDTVASRYITLEDLAQRIKSGTDVVVQDAHSGADLTQATLTQIILESRGGARLLPIPLLVRLIRMGDESLAEFFGRYVSWALELYIGAKQGARQLLPLNPLATAPFAATDALARLVLGASPWSREGAPSPVPPPTEAEPPPAPTGAAIAHAIEAETAEVQESVDDVAQQMAKLRAELDAIKRSLVDGQQGRTKRAAKPAKRVSRKAH